MRFILLLSFFTYSLFALISEPLHSKVTSVNLEEQTLSIHFIEGARVGMYGAIVKNLGESHSIALKWIEITSIEGDSIKAKMIPILALEQSALPSGTWVAEEGDHAVIGYNYHRALLIAPNPSIYKKVTGYHTNKQWIHPDIFTTVLSSHGHPSPLVEDFFHMCRSNNIGSVSLVFDKSIISIDCQSFKIIENKAISLKTNEIQVPFYTRISNIQANWFGEGNDEIQDYHMYYVNLLAQNNPDNKWIQTYKAIKNKENQKGSWFDSLFSSINVTNKEDQDPLQ
ncbi:MAG TPA: hypothetical protein EYO73_02275 [Sulfurimonas sp.]|nr:hypothetical protein [Sulfurimonas sp.]